MKAERINSIGFRSTVSIDGKNTETAQTKAIRDLGNVTADFSVKVPQSYKKISEETLANGLKIYSYKLANGHRVTVVPMEDSPAVVKNYVNVGSLNETSDIKGISHFLEHMAFNGTTGANGHLQLNTGDSFKLVEALGGWTNASTNYAITDYVNSSPLLGENDLETQISVISAMTEDLKLSDDMIEKEKGPVCSEINMILDNPDVIAYDQTVRTLFNIKNPADEMVGGSVKHIKNLTREDVLNYYNKYYTPNNMNLVITGDVNPDEVMEIVSKKFNSNKVSQGNKYEEKLVPVQKNIRKDFISDKAVSTSVVLGFCGAENNNPKDRILYDLASRYLLSSYTTLTQSLKKFNSEPELTSDKISTNPHGNRLITLAFKTADKNCEDALKELYKSISDIQKPSVYELENIKKNLLYEINEDNENSLILNSRIGEAVLSDNIDYIVHAEEIINSITPEELDDAVKRFFNLNKSALTVVHPAKSEVAFKGKQRKPINSEKFSSYNLDNNYSMAFYNTKNPNLSCIIELKTDCPYNKKAGVAEVYNNILKMGTSIFSEQEFSRIKEQNNINVSARSSINGITIYADGIYESRDSLFKAIFELLYNPAISRENLETAKEQVKDSITKLEKNPAYLLKNYIGENSDYEYSYDEILKSIDSITVDDLIDYHNYVTENSFGIISSSCPEQKADEYKKQALEFANSLDKVKPRTAMKTEFYKKVPKTEVIKEENNNSQADILQLYSFKLDPDNIKDYVSAIVLSSILSNSSIGLFDILREKENLAYSVHSKFEKKRDRGLLACSILTTTDNKEIGEISYDNVQKSINGFNRQINKLRAGEFTDKDLNNAKLKLKAELLENEGNYDKVHNIKTGLNTPFGTEYYNKIYETADSLTKEDILAMADRIFSENPLYFISASKDTLDYNKSYLEGLKND